MELTEYENIVTPISQYAQGAIEGKSTIMQQGFHTSAQIYGYLDGDLLADPIQVLYDYVDQHPPADSLRYVIRSVDRGENAASARIEITNWHGHTFTDFFTLLKIDGQWKITNKIFMQH
ncbi:MAG: nuclear transport factor 2 family protein [Cyanobacteria bacterium P01_D01_bin.44]